MATLFGAKRESIRKYRAWWALAIPLVVLVVFGLGFMLLGFDPFAASDQMTVDAFTPDQTVTGSSFDDGNFNIAVWVETDPNMYGFIAKRRTACVPSSYQQMLNKLPTMLRESNSLIQIQYYQFNTVSPLPTGINLATEEGVETLAAFREGQKISSPLAEALYSVPEEEYSTTNALVTVLHALETDTPAIIFTDFEQAEGFDEQEWIGAVKSVFDSGKEIRVLAFKSAFGGILYHYDEEGSDYRYGFANDDKTVKQISTRNNGHKYPRPFYALLIGTSEECDRLSTLLTKGYESICRTSLLDQKTAIREADETSHNLENYIGHTEMSFDMQLPYELLQGVDGKKIKAEPLNGIECVDQSPWGEKYGVYEYSAKKVKNESNQSFEMVYQIVPALEGYETTYTTDAYSATIESIYEVKKEEFTLGSEEPEPQPDVLLGRGPHAQRLSMEISDDTAKWFTLSPSVTAKAEGLTFSLFGNITDSRPGIYRIRIRVTGLHKATQSGETTNLDDGWVSEWSQERQNLFDKLRTQKKSAWPPYPPEKTVDLQERIMQINVARLAASIRDSFLIAEFELDVRMEE